MAHEGEQSAEILQPNQMPPVRFTDLTNGDISDLAATLYQVAQARGIALPESFASHTALDGTPTDELAETKQAFLGQKAAGALAIEASTNVEAEQNSVKEALLEQLRTSTHAGHLSMIEQINRSREGTEKTKLGAIEYEGLAAEFADWFDPAREAYISKALEADPELEFTLCALPDTLVSADEIIQDAREFHGEEPDKKAITASHALPQYSDKEVSGKIYLESERLVRFVLIPNKGMPELGNSVPVQKQELETLQKSHPFLDAPVPLTDMAYRHTLRAMSTKTGEPLKGRGTQQKTFLRSFGMVPKSQQKNDPEDETTYVPGSSIGEFFGEVIIVDSSIPPISQRASSAQPRRSRLLQPQSSRAVIC